MHDKGAVGEAARLESQEGDCGYGIGKLLSLNRRERVETIRLS